MHTKGFWGFLPCRAVNLSRLCAPISIIIGPPMSIMGGPRSMPPFLSNGGNGPRGPRPPKPPVNEACTSENTQPGSLELLSLVVMGPAIQCQPLGQQSLVATQCAQLTPVNSDQSAQKRDQQQEVAQREIIMQLMGLQARTSPRAWEPPAPAMLQRAVPAVVSWLATRETAPWPSPPGLVKHSNIVHGWEARKPVTTSLLEPRGWMRNVQSSAAAYSTA